MISEENIEILLQEAVSLHRAGQFGRAEDLYRAVLGLRPDHAVAACNLGCLAVALDRPEVARYLFDAALRQDPGKGEPWLRELSDCGRWSEVAALAEAMIAAEPHRPMGYSMQGRACAAQGYFDRAVPAFVAALALKPDDTDCLTDLGVTLARDDRDAGRMIRLFERVAKLQPDAARAHINLAHAHYRCGNLRRAQTELHVAIALDPADKVGFNEIGNVLRDLQHPAAETAYRRSLAIDPAYADVHANLGNILQDWNRLGEARASYRQAISLEPAMTRAHIGLGMALLAEGHYREGWIEYEWRLGPDRNGGEGYGITQPRWRGEQVAGRTLLIHAEQGFGDTIQMCRYLPVLAQRGIRTILLVQPKLRRLLDRLPGPDLVLTVGDPIPPFDLHCPMMSLPLALGTTLDTIPAISPLRADPMLAAKWQTRIEANAGLAAGIVWAGNPDLHADRRRSLEADHLTALSGIPGVTFYSLQKESSLPRGFDAIVDLMGKVEDFADTAAVIANLDLVVAVDTAVAHLAATMGKPVWLLNRYDADWRWLRGREDSPWYPTVRQFRQPSPGNWADVLHRVRTALAERDGISPSGGSEA